MIPQILYLMLGAAGLGLVVSRHGDPREDDYDAFLFLGSKIFWSLLLYWGGFFDPLFA